MSSSNFFRISFLLCFVVLSSCAHTVKGTQAKEDRVVAFDYFVLFNANSMAPAVERIYPGKGQELSRAWRAKIFEYNFLLSITGKHKDFLEIVSDALLYTLESNKLSISDSEQKSLVNSFLKLDPWPDTIEGLKELRRRGYKIITISNFSKEMLIANAKAAGITNAVDIFISTEENLSYKPSPRAYALPVERYGMKKRNIVFVAFGGWDAYGAKSYGYKTIWVNRFKVPQEKLDFDPDSSVQSFDELLNQLQ